VNTLLLKSIRTLKNNNTIEEIEQFLDNDCNIFGPFSSTCIQLVNTYLPVIVNYLEQDYPPNVICGLIGLCSNSTTGTSAGSSSSTAPASSSSGNSSGTSSSGNTSTGAAKTLSKIGKKLKKARALKNKIKIAPRKH